MRIHITRRGGVAGVALSAELETEELDRETAARVESALEQLGTTPAAPTHPDAFEYEIAVPGSRAPLRVGESDMPAELRPLLKELSARGTIASRSSAGD